MRGLMAAFALFTDGIQVNAGCTSLVQKLCNELYHHGRKKAMLDRYEKVITSRHHARHVLGLPQSAPIALVMAECNLLPFAGVHTKRVTHLCESLRASGSPGTGMYQLSDCSMRNSRSGPPRIL